MDIHQNARLTPRGRARLVEQILSGMAVSVAAAAAGVSAKTARKWLGRFQEAGQAGLLDRSSRPHHSPSQLGLETRQRIVELRHAERLSCERIAALTRASKASVARTLARCGLNRLSRIDPPAPVQRYEHAAPGDLLHLDVKKLGRIGCVGHRIHGDYLRRSRGIGWEFVHVAIDDHSRIAYSRIEPDERGDSAVGFLFAAVTYYRSLSITIAALLTDNASCYHSKLFRAACGQLGLRHRFTRPYRPRTNGKAERFIQTALREWAYQRAYPDSARRSAELPIWLHHYNWHRPHASLGRLPPIARSGLAGNNVLRLHT